MVTRGAQEHAAQSTKVPMPPIWLSDFWRLGEQFETVRKLVCKQIGCGRPVGGPPSVDGSYLRLGFRLD
jgi:hypothetical protein